MTTDLGDPRLAPLARWTTALPRDTDPAAATAAGRRLLDRWSEPHRHYHTIEHLTAVLDVVDRHADLTEDPAPVRLAAWFHDAVYDPRASDNEQRSAELADRELAGLGVDPAIRAEVARLVLLTTGHETAPGDVGGALLVDADLAILAADPARYDEYADGVRLEYRHLPDEVFGRGRAAVLEHLLTVPVLYRLLPDAATMCRAARANLRRELATLAGADRHTDAAGR